MREVRRAPVRRDTSGREVGHTRPPRSHDDPDVRPDRDRPGPARREGALDQRLAPRGRDVLGAGRPRGGPAQPDLVDLRRAPRLLGLADLERQLRRSCSPRASSSRRSSCSSWWRCPTWSARCSGCPTRSRCRSSAAATGPWSVPPCCWSRRSLFAYAVQQPGHAVLGLLPDRRDRRLRRRQLRLLDGEHQLLLPGRQEGHRARPERRRRQPRRVASSSSSCR